MTTSRLSSTLTDRTHTLDAWAASQPSVPATVCPVPTKPGWYWLRQFTNDEWVPAEVQDEDEDGDDDDLTVKSARMCGWCALDADTMKYATWGPRLVPPG